MKNRLIIYTLLSVICNHEVFGTETVQQPELQNQEQTVSTCEIKAEDATAEAFRTKTMQAWDADPLNLRVDIVEVKANLSVFCEILRDSPLSTSLSNLDVYNSDPTQQLTLDECEKISEAVAGLYLCRVGFENCGIRDNGAEGVSKILAVCPGLVSCNLNGNFITSTGLDTICRSLAKCTNLLCLKMANNQITNIDLSHSFKEPDSLKQLLLNTHIRHFDFRNNAISNVFFFAQGARHNFDLIKFRLDSNPCVFTDSDSVKIINKTVEDNRKILRIKHERYKDFTRQMKAIALHVEWNDLSDVLTNLDQNLDEK